MKKRIDLSNLIYVGIMIVVFLLGSCKSTKEVVPAPKYGFELPTPVDTFMNLKYENYQSSIDTSFNYLDDAIEVFKTTNL
tara:strand:+ start:379 stop:618 length:240 start_codon:yes stop_codon:yes gene_type:complete